MIDHILSEQLYLFFIVFINVIPGTWSISKCCPNSIRIPSWLRNSHCRERRSHQRLISAVGLFPAIWRFFLYWISTRLHLFNTNTERWHQLQNKLLWNDLLKVKPKCQLSLGMHLAACNFFFFLSSMSPGSSHPSIQRGAKPLTGDLPITVPSSVTFKFGKLWPTFICTAYSYCRVFHVMKNATLTVSNQDMSLSQYMKINLHWLAMLLLCLDLTTRPSTGNSNRTSTS